MGDQSVVTRSASSFANRDGQLVAEERRRETVPVPDLPQRFEPSQGLRVHGAWPGRLVQDQLPQEGGDFGGGQQPGLGAVGVAEEEYRFPDRPNDGRDIATLVFQAVAPGRVRLTPTAAGDGVDGERA